MISVIVNAYACCPGMGSEPGMAWNWCVNLAKFAQLHIITEGEFRDKIEAALRDLPHGSNMKFYYNPVSDNIREMCWNQGDWRFYRHYKKWQLDAYKIAINICNDNDIKILHQLNMIGFREPGYLWKIESIPFVWGPVDAKAGFPVEYLSGASLGDKVKVYLKNFLTKIQLKYSQRVHKAGDRASAILAASSNSYESLQALFPGKVTLLNETGCYPNNFLEKNTENKQLELLWVGKLDFRKQLNLAIQALAECRNKNVRLHIVGGGDGSKYMRLSKDLNLTDQCIWHGAIPHANVQKIMRESDMLFFTSVAEGTPHVVLEAIGNGLPVLCFDTCGQGDVVNERVGFKVKLGKIGDSVRKFSMILREVESNRHLLKALSINCYERQKELSWDNKAKVVANLYNECISR